MAVVLLFACQNENIEISNPTLELLSGISYTQNNEEVAVGGKLMFAVKANGGGQPLTNILVKRITETDTIIEVDLGLYVEDIDFEYEINASKSEAEVECWQFVAMNANRDTVSVSQVVRLGQGVDYGSIKHFESIKIGMQDNTEFPHFLDATTGTTFTNATVVGNEAKVDILAFVYFTSDKWSPTLNCPQNTIAPSYYPTVNDWGVRNITRYDYKATDNNLISLDEFQKASNDSLLVKSYNPGNTNGNCKFCFTGKLVPFKTEQGKYGIIRVVYADTTTEGYMELEIKIQE